MPQLTIPLVGNIYSRPFIQVGAKDVLYSAVFFQEIMNSVIRQKSIFACKRSGFTSSSTPAAGSQANMIFSSPSLTTPFAAFGSSGDIYRSLTTSYGSAGSRVLHMTETILNGLTYILITTATACGYVVADALITSADSSAQNSYTVDTHTSTLVDNIASTAGMYVGQSVTGSGFQANTRIAAVQSSVAITLTLATTTSLSATTLTKSPFAKIIDADFPTDPTGPMAEMDGYLFIATKTGRLYNSDLNSVTSWAADSYITANAFTDGGIACIKRKNKIGFFGTSSLEWFYNAGNPSGSVLSRSPGDSLNIGCKKFGNGNALLASGHDILCWIDNIGNINILSGDSTKPLSYIGLPAAATASIKEINIFPHLSDVLINFCSDLVSAQPLHQAWYSIKQNLWINPGFPAPTHIADSDSPTAFFLVDEGTTGKLFSLVYGADSSIVYQDNGAAYTMTIQTEPKVLNGGDPFIVKRTRLLADNQSSGSSTYSQSADDYATFTDIGSFDLTQAQKEIYGGLYCENSCAFKITDAGNNAWRGQAIVVDWEPCKV